MRCAMAFCPAAERSDSFVFSAARAPVVDAEHRGALGIIDQQLLGEFREQAFGGAVVLRCRGARRKLAGGQRGYWT